jgi:hypothetical protein
VGLAELLKTIDKLGRCFTAVLDLFLDLVEEHVEFSIDLEQRILL